MNVWMRAVLVTVILSVLVLGYHRRFKEESFVNASNQIFQRTNEGPEPWKRHPITSESVVVDTPIKYSRAYYYELDNAAYDKALQYTFAHNCKAAKDADVVSKNQWITLSPDQDGVRILQLQSLVLSYLRKQVTTSKYLQLKNKTPSMIQIVHDVLISAEKHAVNPSYFIYRMECILYREYAPHGKHVALDVFLDLSQKDKPDVVVIKQDILGIVSAENIGLHPFLATDPQEMIQSELPFDPNPLVPYPATLVDEKTIQVVMQQQEAKQLADRKASEAVGRNRYE